MKLIGAKAAQAAHAEQEDMKFLLVTTDTFPEGIILRSFDVMVFII